MEELVDLDWLWTQSESELGLRSGHGALEARLSGIWTVAQNSEMTDRRLEAAAKASRIMKRFGSLPQVHKRILRTAYMPRPLDKSKVSRHGVRLSALLASNLGPKKNREEYFVLALTRAVIAYKRGGT